MFKGRISRESEGGFSCTETKRKTTFLPFIKTKNHEYKKNVTLLIGDEKIEQLIIDSQIPDEIAKIFIGNYTSGLPASSLKSIWLDNALLYYIYTHYQNQNMNGLRIYLAKYSVAGDIHTGDSRIGKNTMIAVPTNDLHGQPTAISGAFFNYGSLCPDTCPPTGTW